MPFLSPFNSMTHFYSNVGCLFTLYSLSDLIYPGFQPAIYLLPQSAAFLTLLPIDVLQATQTSSPSPASFSKFPFTVKRSVVHPITKFGHYTRLFAHVKSSLYNHFIIVVNSIFEISLSLQIPSVDLHCYCPEGRGYQWGQYHPEGKFWKIWLSMPGTFTDCWNH